MGLFHICIIPVLHLCDSFDLNGIIPCNGESKPMLNVLGKAEFIFGRPDILWKQKHHKVICIQNSSQIKGMQKFAENKSTVLLGLIWIHIKASAFEGDSISYKVHIHIRSPSFFNYIRLPCLKQELKLLHQ